jgi:hypothetical protein
VHALALKKTIESLPKIVLSTRGAKVEESWLGRARLGVARQGVARHGMARPGVAWWGWARHGVYDQFKKGDFECVISR